MQLHRQAGHLVKFYETKRFKELEAEWEQRLAETGFKDAEKKIGNSRDLKQYAENVYQSARHDARDKYFDLLSECFLKEIFLEHKIMQDYVAGKRRVEILKELLASGVSIEYETIRFIIRRYEYRWGIKNYSARQMNLKKLPIRS